MTTATEQALAILNDKQPLPQDLQALNRALMRELEFGLARKLLERALAHTPQDHWVVQQLALATCKDEELVPALRVARALALLEGIGLGDPALADGETLTLGGAVYKRRWEQGGRLEDLQTAFALYHAAWERGSDGVATDRRLYAAVNAAFILDLLAARGRAIGHRSGTAEQAAAEFAARARALREQALPLAAQRQQALSAVADVEDRYWILASYAELQFGLANWDQAGAALERAGALLATDAWAVQATLRQLATLARSLEGAGRPPQEGQPLAEWLPAWKALARLVGADAPFALANDRGKVGLALSGGGFRASLFHLGVLARLAEMDVLRSVEVLSTVSGGSIVGAHYYLEVQRLLESRADAEISGDDYLQLVLRLQQDFCAGVSRNMRMRTLANLWANLRFAFSSRYTRSNLLGELYEAHFFSRVQDGRGTRERLMRDLLVAPKGEPPHFSPRAQNWRRRAKVPVLMLNATSLNSGHNWQFTGRWMGEPPAGFDAGVDLNERYRRLWYEQAPTPELQRWRTGDAVASSACVPGLFEPLVLHGLYPDRTVRLVDGGVHDNQGVEGLLGEGCMLVLASDASGQMADESDPPANRLAVPLRANSILMDRVREAEYQDLQARVESRSLRGLFFVHMKQGLDVAPLDWIGCDNPTAAPTAATCTDYGIDKTLQRQLAAVRTDLDSFSEVEAATLMLSGYLMTERQFRDLQQAHEDADEPGSWGGFRTDAPRGDWPFLALAEIARLTPDAADPRRQELGIQIAVASKPFLKVWFLSSGLRRLALGGGALAALAAIAWLALHWNDALDWSTGTLTVWQLVLTSVVFALGVVMPALRWLMPQQALRGVVLDVLLAVGGWLAGHLHLWLFDPLFLRLGRLARLLDRR